MTPTQHPDATDPSPQPHGDAVRLAEYFLRGHPDWIQNSKEAIIQMADDLARALIEAERRNAETIAFKDANMKSLQDAYEGSIALKAHIATLEAALALAYAQQRIRTPGTDEVCQRCELLIENGNLADE